MAPITRQDFRQIDFVFAAVGEVFTTPTRKFRLVEYNRRLWSLQPTRGLTMDEDASSLHSLQPTFQVIVDQYVKANPAGVPVRLNITGFRQIKPCGIHVAVRGKIGHRDINAIVLWPDARHHRDEIEVIVVCQHAFYLTFSLNRFSLAVFEVVEEEVTLLPSS